MSAKIEQYRQKLRELPEWDAYLLAESGLPGPRGNLELAQAVAAEGEASLFERYRAFDPIQAPANSPEEFLAFCGTLGCGRLLSAGRSEMLAVLRQAASDPRWRIREAVAMALQSYGATDMEALINEMEAWSAGSYLEQRAAAAALCEPVPLKDPHVAGRVLSILDRITAAILNVSDRKSADFRVLRQGLAYCWSVAVAASPADGKPLMEKWLASPDPDIAWIMQENLKKKRLARVDADWVARWQKR